MGLELIIALILLIIIVAGGFSYRMNASYATGGSFAVLIAAILLFLMAIHVIHLG